MDVTEDTGWGLSIRAIEADTFRDFVRHFGTSDEIGPIATALDKAVPGDPKIEIDTLGLYGCETLCAVACLVITEAADDKLVCKLDSVIVDQALRRRGLAKVLVTSTFSALVTNSAGRLDRVYAHSVHPATVRLLTSLGFSPPPPIGSPLSVVNLKNGAEEKFVAQCDDARGGISQRLKLQCTFCSVNDRRSRPWCRP